ncbi:MAG TPA: Bax inhibitor-1/YccA family protein [Candidatus Avelusimicrobium excrementipullorum]|nr:Bax inhibitor-1/YccA family protein [Candidatus Avelusimicrobium excrementipullorum]
MPNGNPLFNENAFRQAMSRTEGAMTLQGTINKTFFLLLMCTVGALISWNNIQAVAGYTSLIAIVTFAIAMIVIFKKTAAPVLAPLYALGEGLVLGIISAAYNAQYQGIVGQAIAITFLVFFIMLFLYKTRIIKVTNSLVIGITAATGAIALFYIISLLLSVFGVNVAYFGSTSALSIGINVVICAVAAFNFLIDFRFIDQLTSQVVAPKYMEWYAGFSLIVTLVWLYLEILRLLARTRDN